MSDCSQPPDKPKLVQYARKIDLKSSPFGQYLFVLRSLKRKRCGGRSFAEAWISNINDYIK